MVIQTILIQMVQYQILEQKSFMNQNCQINGDLNNDTIVNVLDAIDLVNWGNFTMNGCNICYDMNYDSNFNILDILNLINIIIN